LSVIALVPDCAKVLLKVTGPFSDTAPVPVEKAAEVVWENDPLTINPLLMVVRPENVTAEAVDWVIVELNWRGP
jgi:hypothetical protein